MATRRTRSSSRRTSRPRRRSHAGRFIAILAAIVVVAGLAIYQATAAPEAAPAASAAVGTKSLLAVDVPRSVPQQTVEYTGFTVNFNRDKHVPNYVAWELTAEKAAGTLPRGNKFAPDPRVRGCAELDDYRRSGFDRGHMAPAGDMKWSARAMDDCFYFSNMCPQTKRLNSGKWNDLEKNTRRWATIDGQLIIIAGPVLTDRITRTIGAGRVAVPNRFFKVIYSPAKQQMVAFVFSNTDLPEAVKDAACSVDDVEAITGMDFFAALPDELENKLESQNNYARWQRSHRK